MIKMTLHKNELRITFDYDPDLVLAVKRIPGKRPHYEDGKFLYWSVPIKWEIAEALGEFAVQGKTDIPPEVLNAIQQDEIQRAGNVSLSQADKPDQVMRLEIPGEFSMLRTFQRAGVQYILRNKNVLIGDDMGLGKTLQAIAAVEIAGNLPCLIVCPASLKYNWRREIEKWRPERVGKIEILNGKNPWPFYRDDHFNGVQYVIVNYDVLKKHDWLFAIPWRCLVVDESHFIKNYKAQRTKAVLEIAKNSGQVILLSGTPILNRPIELVPQLQAIGMLDRVFGGFWQYAHRYCEAYKGEYGWVLDGAANLDELNQKIREYCFLRREKKNVLTELPDKIRTVIPVEISNRDEYVHAREELIAYIRDHGRVTKKFLEEIEARGLSDEEKKKAISEYRHSKAERAARAETLVRIETLKQVTARGKMAMVGNWLRDFLEASPNDKVLIFATHQDVIEDLKKLAVHLGTVALCITGDTPAEARDHQVQLFQDDPQFRIFILNIQAGGVGLTLTAASYELFVEYAWNAGTMDQAEDRAYRIGQKNAVNVYWMAGQDTIDEMMIDLIESKREIVAQVTNDLDVVEIVANYLEKEQTNAK